MMRIVRFLMVSSRFTSGRWVVDGWKEQGPNCQCVRRTAVSLRTSDVLNSPSVISTEHRLRWRRKQNACRDSWVDIGIFLGLRVRTKRHLEHFFAPQRQHRDTSWWHWRNACENWRTKEALSKQLQPSIDNCICSICENRWLIHRHVRTILLNLPLRLHVTLLHGFKVHSNLVAVSWLKHFVCWHNTLCENDCKTTDRGAGWWKLASVFANAWLSWHHIPQQLLCTQRLRSLWRSSLSALPAIFSSKPINEH